MYAPKVLLILMMNFNLMKNIIFLYCLEQKKIIIKSFYFYFLNCKFLGCYNQEAGLWRLELMSSLWSAFVINLELACWYDLLLWDVALEPSGWYAGTWWLWIWDVNLRTSILICCCSVLSMKWQIWSKFVIPSCDGQYVIYMIHVLDFNF
jgi:hypothetical protein